MPRARSALRASGLFAALLLTTATALAADGPEVFSQLGHSNVIHAVAFSPNGRFLASAGEDGGALLWDVPTSREFRSLTHDAIALDAISFSADGNIVATGAHDGTVVLWDAGSGRKLQVLASNSDPINAVVFAHLGHVLATASEDHTIKLWDASTGKELRTLAGHHDAVTSLSFSADDHLLASGSKDKTIKLWDTVTGKEIRTLTGHTDRVSAVTFCRAANATVVSASWDHTLKQWDAASGRELRTLRGHTSEVWSAACSPDGRTIASGGYDHSVRLWDATTGEERRSIPADAGWVESVTFSPDGRTVVSAGADHSIKQWNAVSGELQHTLEGHADYVKSASFSPNGHMLVTAGADHDVRLWRMSDGHLLRTIAAHTRWVGSVTFAPDNHVVASRSGDGTVKLWDILTGKALQTFAVGTAQSGSNSIAFSPDGHMFAAGRDNHVVLWHLPDGVQVQVLDGHTGSVEAVAFSPDGRTLASGDSRGAIKIWEMTSGYELHTLSGHTSWVGSIAFSPDGRMLASGSGDKSVRLWNLGSGQARATLHGHEAPVTCVAFSSKDGLLASSDEYGVVRLWNAGDGQQRGTLVGHTDLVESVTFSPDGRLIATASADSTIRLWDAQSAVERLRLIAFRDGSVLRLTPQGYYDSQGDRAEDDLNVRADGIVSGIAAYRERFYRPDLVRLALNGQPLPAALPTIASVKPAPDIAVINAPAQTDASQLDLQIRVTDRGGGIGTVRTYLNESAVSESAGTGSSAAAPSIIHIKLVPGRNDISVVAFNADGSKRSNAAQATIAAHFDPAGKPQLHALVVGIQDFDNPDIALRYSVADAQAFAELLQAKAGPLFSKVNIETLTTKAATTKGAIEQALARYRTIEPRDVFLFYVATHGTVEGSDIGNPEYFLIPSNMKEVSTEGIRREALGEREIRRLVASIPATRKLILLDTCHAGAMGDAMLLTTRTLEEDGAVNVLSGAVGSTVLSASTSDQEALEGENGHGLFTWVLLQGLGGQADVFHNGSIKTFELAAYVANEVPKAAEQLFKRTQIPNLHNAGQSFEIVRTN